MVFSSSGGRSPRTSASRSLRLGWSSKFPLLSEDVLSHSQESEATPGAAEGQPPPGRGLSIGINATALVAIDSAGRTRGRPAIGFEPAPRLLQPRPLPAVRPHRLPGGLEPV